MDIEAIDSKLLEFIIFKLDFIVDILNFSRELTSEQEREVLDLLNSTHSMTLLLKL